MKIAIQVPIKGKSSERIPNKNFARLRNKPLCHWLLKELSEIKDDTIEVFVDSEDREVYEKVEKKFPNLDFHQRPRWFAEDHANGNHLIHQFALAHPQFDAYAQIFVTAVGLRRRVIEGAIQCFKDNIDTNDSLFLVTEETGWIWKGGAPVNYDSTRPNGLPRSQDACYFKETTVLYISQRDAVLQTGCRIGKNPYLYPVDRKTGLDIDTVEDLNIAEILLKDEEN